MADWKYLIALDKLFKHQINSDWRSYSVLWKIKRKERVHLFCDLFCSLSYKYNVILITSDFITFNSTGLISFNIVLNKLNKF